MGDLGTSDVDFTTLEGGHDNDDTHLCAYKRLSPPSLPIVENQEEMQYPAISLFELRLHTFMKNFAGWH